MTFDEIGIKHGGDKNSSIHDYLEKYEKHLGHLRDTKFNLLEIGVAGGHSLRAWQEIFPKANIYGIDIDPKCKAHESDRIKVFIGSQTDGDFLNKTMDEIGDVSVIIDDGSHIMEHEIFSFETLFPRLNPNGHYIFEDLATCFGEGGDRPLPRFLLRPNVIDYMKDKVSDIHSHGFVEGFGSKQREYDFLKNRLGSYHINYYDEYIKCIAFYRFIIFVEKDSGLKK